MKYRPYPEDDLRNDITKVYLLRVRRDLRDVRCKADICPCACCLINKTMLDLVGTVAAFEPFKAEHYTMVDPPAPFVWHESWLELP